MPPVRMTRAEYEAQYGTKPVASSSADFDTSPAPVRMTRAEYSALYRPKTPTFTQDLKTDISETKTAQQEALNTGAERAADIETRTQTGETSTAKGLFQKFGTGLGTASNILFQTALGGAKAILPQGVETRVAETLGKDLEKIFSPETRKQFVERLKESEGGVLTGKSLDQKAGVMLEEIGNAYKTDANFRSDVQAAGGIVEWLSIPGASKSAVVKSAEAVAEVTDLAKPAIKDIANEIKNSTKFTATPEARVSKQANDILNVENKYKTIRESNTRLGRAAEESRLRIARSNVLEGSVDETGRINTNEAIKAYQKQTIDGYEDVIKKNLETEGKKVNLKEIETAMRANVMDSGLEGSALYTALKGIDKQIKGLSVRADAFGDVLLSRLQDAKISEYKSIDYQKVNQSIYKKTLARTYKEIIEQKSDLDVKGVNAELSKFYGDIERLRNLDGKIVEGGKLGRYGSQLAGTVVGVAGGSTLGGPGAAIGGILGGEIAQKLKGKAMASTFSRGIDGVVPESQILKDAKSPLINDLKTASPKVGVPAGIKKTDEMIKIESQISRNIDLQKKAIKAGDYTLVAELKSVYQMLVEKLKALIEDYRKNGPPIGLSIRKSVTPESVASKMDDVDFNRLVSIIEDPFLAKNDPDISRMISEMGLSRATDDELVDFAKKATDKYEEIQNSNRLISDQNQATNPPTNAQNISENIPAETPEVKGATPQTTALLEEAKKYKSAEEFVKAQPKFYHGGEKIDSVSTRKSRFQNTFYFTESPDYAKSYGGKNSVVNEIYLDPSTNLIDLRNPSKEVINAIADKLMGKETGKIIKITRPDGSVLDIPEVKGGASNPVYTNKQILQGIVDGKAMFIELPEVKKILKEMGYDGLITTESKMGSNYGVWNADKVKTRKEMEDVWNKS